MITRRNPEPTSKSGSCVYSTRRLCVRQDIRPRKVLFVASMQQLPVFTLAEPFNRHFLSIRTRTLGSFRNKIINSYKFITPDLSTGMLQLLAGTDRLFTLNP
jgi:hypothetical protein